MPLLDIRQHDLATLQTIFRQFPHVEEARLFGSRALGGAKKTSDIDLSISASRLTLVEWGDLRQMLEEAPIIFELDIVRFDTLPEGRLRRKIQTEGVVIHPK